MNASLEDRITRLETSNRRMRLMLLGVAMAGVAGVGLGMNKDSKGPDGPPDVIRAKCFEVVNDWGEVLVRATTNGDGGGWFTMYDGAGETSIGAIGTPDEGGSIGIFNHFGGVSAMINTDDAGNGSIQTYQGSRMGAVKIGWTENGEGSITTYDSDGGKLVALDATDRSEGRITTFNGQSKWIVGEQSRPLVEIGTTDGGQGLIVLNDRHGAADGRVPRSE